MVLFSGGGLSLHGDKAPSQSHSAGSAPDPAMARSGAIGKSEDFFGEAEAKSRMMKLGVSAAEIKRCRREAHKNGSTITGELISNGSLDETLYYQTLASDLGLEFIESVDPDSLIVLPGHALSTLRGAATMKALTREGESFLLSAPDDHQLAVLVRSLSRRSGLRTKVRLTTRTCFNAALMQRMSERALEGAVFSLKNRMPDYSASLVATGAQGFFGGCALSLFALIAWAYPNESILLIHFFATFLFAACVLIRVRAAARFQPAEKLITPADTEGPYPIYSVIVALYQETEVISQLLSNLTALNWPASRLEIMLVCEASDTPTIQSLEARIDRSRVQIIRVPKLGPQTKPRALSFALEAARGEFVVIYDAEDRPHSEQLMEAYRRFQCEPISTACLQAPLVVTNQSEGFLARMFAFEYAALFGGLLPYLSVSGRFIPLGGTSNHFRRSVLQHIGGWDPYNVTEDADLGARLCRLGYSTGTISCPTLEDAPTRFSQWRPQRVRWFKGWLQTWLVHMRNPRALLNELGASDFMRFQLLTVGMILSALVYPSMLAAVAWAGHLVLSGSVSAVSSSQVALFGIDICNVMLGHLAFFLLGAKVEKARGLRPSAFLVLLLPIYWSLLSVAAWGALWELIRRPHHWNKTEHSPARAPVPD